MSGDDPTGDVSSDVADEPSAAPVAGPANLSDLIRRHAADRGAAEALVRPAAPGQGERQALSWADLDAMVDAVAAGYAERGLRAGHRLGLAGGNSLDFVVCYLAALRAGLVAVPLDGGADADPRERDSIAGELGLRALLGADGPLDAAELARSALDHPRGTAIVSPPDRESLAVLLRSVGSEDSQRWAMFSHRALLAPLVAAGVDALGAVGAPARLVAAVPLSHVFGLTAVLGGWLASGARLVLAEPYGNRLAAVIAAEAVDVLPATPGLLLRLLRSDPTAEDLRSLRWVLAGGASVPEWLAREFGDRTGLRIERGYGLSETAGGVSATFGGPVLGPTHVGRPLPGVEVRIRTETGGPAAPSVAAVDEPGLIELRGANLFAGYWPDGADGADADGWFRTDDVGYLRDGELFLLDRGRELITVQGFPVFPAEVEQVLREFPSVTGAAAVGVPDERRGRRIVAYVTGDVSVDALAEHCRRLAPYKRPTKIHVVDDLPLDALGEVHRSALRHRVAGGTADSS